MGLYTDYVLPWLLHLAMRNQDLVPFRQRVVGAARGRVLELGIGSGLNLPYYPAEVDGLYGVEPSARLVQMAQKQAARVPFRVDFWVQSGESVPLDDASLDTVVSTWTLCTVAEVHRTLHEMHRVLKPEGQFLFVEHGLAPDARVAAWQHRLTPIWKPIAGGCHLDRPIDRLIRDAGFRLEDLQTTYARGPRPWTYFYWGRARR